MSINGSTGYVNSHDGTSHSETEGITLPHTMMGTLKTRQMKEAGRKGPHVAASFNCGSLRCASQLHCVSYKLKVCGYPVSSKSTGAIVPTAFAHFLCLSHFANSHSISSFHYYICYGDLWSATFDAIIAIVLGRHESHPYKMTSLTDKCCACSDCSANWLSPHLLPSLWVSLWDTTILKLGQLITLQWPLTVQGKGRVPRLSLQIRSQK